MGGITAIDLRMLPLSTRMEKSRILGTLNCFCDLDMKGFQYLIVASGAKIIILLNITFLVCFEDREGLVSILQYSGCLLVCFATCHCEGLVGRYVRHDLVHVHYILMLLIVVLLIGLLWFSFVMSQNFLGLPYQWGPIIFSNLNTFKMLVMGGQ